MASKSNQVLEWQKQAKYDLDTAAAMLKAGRFIYCVFMCHLSLEKILKGLYLKDQNKTPPKVHSLVYLVQTQNLKLSQPIIKFLEHLDEVSIPTRYPEQLDQMLSVYDKKRTQDVFNQTQKAFRCLNEKLEK